MARLTRAVGPVHRGWVLDEGRVVAAGLLLEQGGALEGEHERVQGDVGHARRHSVADEIANRERGQQHDDHAVPLWCLSVWLGGGMSVAISVACPGCPAHRGQRWIAAPGTTCWH